MLCAKTPFAWLRLGIDAKQGWAQCKARKRLNCYITNGFLQAAFPSLLFHF